MKRFWRRVLSGGLWVAVLSLLLCHGAWARTVLIWNSDSSCDPARHALQHLVKTLEEKGSSVTVVADRATAKERSGRGVIEIRTPDAELTSEWEKPESYRIQVEAGTPRKHIVITGSDAVGLMYGIFEIAEQVAMTTFNGDSLWAALHEASGTPALEIRADNPFLTLEKDRSISPWFYDEGFWREYFDTLARNRFNLCDIHAMYVFEDTSFPNLIPYFLRNHERPGTSMPNESLERNLAMLNRIIDLGEERGVHVALMNYSMDFPGIDPGDEATQVEHTRWAVAELLKRCPRLWMFGFRIGESGKSEGFFERSFLEGIRSSGKEDVRLYTRTWGAEFKDLAQIGMAYPENFYIEIKYNGEHLGAPYHAIQGGGASYSYQTYLKYPRYWKIIWQIRANGTHRLFPWYDPAFTRRCVQSSAFGDAIGFTLEPHTAYYTQDSSLVLREREDANLFPYVFERHWAWYMSWGRLAYNPETPDAVFDKAFERRFGKEAGQRVADVLTVASRIVPLIYRHHCLGPDHRNMAPEFETGNNSNYNAGQSIVQDIDSFAQVGGLDGQTHISPAAYVKDYLKRELAGKVSPLEAAERLEALASQCVEWLDDTEVTEGHREWALLSNDVRALASLARYYVEKDRAACALQFYYETHDASQAIAAKKHVLEAREQWRRLDEVASRQYRSILDRLRMGWEFTWGKMLPDLDADLARVEAVITEIEQEESPRSGHVPVFQATSGEALELSVGVAGLKDPAVVLHYSIDDASERSVPCVVTGRWSYRGTIPGEAMKEGARVRYWFTANAAGTALRVPNAGADVSFSLTITTDREGPSIAWNKAEEDREAGVMRVECVIDDPSEIAEARLEWKPMPSETAWSEPIRMTRRGKTNIYTGDIPLTAEGLLYSAVALDGHGNASRYPDVRVETPYVSVNPWDPGLSADMRLQSEGTLSGGLKRKSIQWQDVSGTGRPGTYYEYSGSRGRVSFPFTIESFSDNVLTLGRVINGEYGSADIFVDERKIGLLKGKQEGPGYLPAQEEYHLRGLTAGEHTLSFVSSGDGRFAVEGFQLTSQPAIVDRFLISQSFEGFAGESGKDLYPVGNKTIEWHTAETDDRGIVPLHAQLKPNENCHGFAATVLRCEESVKTDLLVGSNDGCFVWLNGELVHSAPGKRYYAYNGDRIPVTLKKGDNLLVLLVMQAGRYWLFNVNSESYAFTSVEPDLAVLQRAAK